MTSIFSGTRLAFLVGESPKKRQSSIYEDEAEVVLPSTADSIAKSNAPLASKAAKGGNRVLKASWLVFAVLTILIPVLVRNARMNRYQNQSWGNVAQQYNQYQQQGARFTDVNKCKWYNFGCTPYYVNEQGQYVSEYEMQQEKYRQEYEQKQQNYQNQAQGNSYYQAQQARAGASGTTAALRFVYAWQIIMFAAIVAYGYSVLHYGKNPSYLIGALAVWFQFNFLSMFMLADGSMNANDDNLSGRYGQFATLMFMTDLGYGIFGFVFAFIFFARASVNVADEFVVVDPIEKAGEYQAYEAPPSPPSSPKSDPEEGYVKVV